MKTRFTTFLAAGSGLTALLLFVPTVRADDNAKPVLLTRTFKKGDTVRTTTKTVAQVGDVEAIITQTSSQLVKDVKPTGEVVLEETSEGGKAQYSGMERDIPGGTVSTETYDKAGHLAEHKQEGGDSTLLQPNVQLLLTTAYHLLLSDKPVAPGATWENTLDDPAAKGKKVTLKTTFVGVEKLNGVDVWKVKQTSEADIEGAMDKAAFEETAWLDASNGQTIKMEATAKNVPSNFGVMSWTITSAKAKDDAKKPATL